MLSEISRTNSTRNMINADSVETASQDNPNLSLDCEAGNPCLWSQLTLFIKH